MSQDSTFVFDRWQQRSFRVVRRQRGELVCRLGATVITVDPDSDRFEVD